MTKTRYALLLAFIWCMSTGASAPEEMRPVKIADGVYMFENNRGTSNATVIMTEEGVVVFDFNILTADQVLAGLRKFTDKKVRYLISSHSALDHASGAWYFRDDKPTYIATKTKCTISKCRSWLVLTNARNRRILAMLHTKAKS
jgi:metallo-beta-lactamase superfamily protein